MIGVQSKKVFSPQEFLEIMTGKTFIINSDNDIEYIHKILKQEGIEDEEYPIYDYPVDKIDVILDAETYVVLVDCLVWDESCDQFKHEYRWFECGDDFEGKEEEVNNI